MILRKLRNSGALALGLCLSTGTALADTVASGDPSSLLNVDDGFITGLPQPTALEILPDGRFVITLREGHVLVGSPDNLEDAGSFEVKSNEGEMGLLNVLAHPDFESNHLLYFYYSAGDGNGGTGMNRHRVVTVELGDDNTLDMSTEETILDGLRGSFNHNGGALSIYGDKLFVGSGDTGSNSSQGPNAMEITNYFGTCLTNANGKVLRVNLDGSIPSDNPLVGETVTQCGAEPYDELTGATSNQPRTEIFAWGFRNPWRVWADPQTGNLWVGDVGEVTYEEINVVPSSGGLHFGWPFREGNEGHALDSCTGIDPDVGDCRPPAYVCETNGGSTQPDNASVPNGCDSISGGLIPSDCEWPAEFEGSYVFGDFQDLGVWTLGVNEARDNVVGARRELLTTQGGGVVHFTERGGALYLVVHGGNGHITRITPNSPDDSCTGSGGNGTGGMAGTGGKAATGGTPGGGEAGDDGAGGTTAEGGTTGQAGDDGSAGEPVSAPTGGRAGGQGGRASGNGGSLLDRGRRARGRARRHHSRPRWQQLVLGPQQHLRQLANRRRRVHGRRRLTRQRRRRRRLRLHRRRRTCLERRRVRLRGGRRAGPQQTPQARLVRFGVTGSWKTRRKQNSS